MTIQQVRNELSSLRDEFYLNNKKIESYSNSKENSEREPAIQNTIIKQKNILDRIFELNSVIEKYNAENLIESKYQKIEFLSKQKDSLCELIISLPSKGDRHKPEFFETILADVKGQINNIRNDISIAELIFEYQSK